MPFVYPLRVIYFDAVSILMFYYNFGEINSFFLSFFLKPPCSACQTDLSIFSLGVLIDSLSHSYYPKTTRDSCRIAFRSLIIRKLLVTRAKFASISI